MIFAAQRGAVNYFNQRDIKMKIKSLCFIAAMLAAPLTANAAYVTINESGLDAIFSQSSFGANTVDIRIGPTTQFVRPDLLDISTDAEIGDLFSLHTGLSNIVNFYYVDTISSCGSINPSIIGCGQVGGPNFVVESLYAADNSIPSGGIITVGNQLLAHELGHNLGLSHRTGNDLMNPFINGFMDLNATEVSIILASPLVQTDTGGQRFITINPVLIMAAEAIPEPSSAILLLVGIIAASIRSRKARLAGLPEADQIHHK